MICPVCKIEMENLKTIGTSKYNAIWACNKSKKHECLIFIDGYWSLKKGHLNISYDPTLNNNNTFIYIGNHDRVSFDFKVEFEDSYNFLIKYLRLKSFL